MTWFWIKRVISNPSRAVHPNNPVGEGLGNKDRVAARLRVSYHYRMDTIRISSSFSTRNAMLLVSSMASREFGVVLPYLAPSP